MLPTQRLNTCCALWGEERFRETLARAPLRWAGSGAPGGHLLHHKPQPAPCSSRDGSPHTGGGPRVPRADPIPAEGGAGSLWLIPGHPPPTPHCAPGFHTYHRWPLPGGSDGRVRVGVCLHHAPPLLTHCAPPDWGLPASSSGWGPRSPPLPRLGPRKPPQPSRSSATMAAAVTQGPARGAAQCLQHSEGVLLVSPPVHRIN